MRTGSSGMSLVGILIVVSIVGTLAVVSFSAYQKIQARSQVEATEASPR